MPDVHRFASFQSLCRVSSMGLDDVESTGTDVVAVGAPIDWGTTQRGRANFVEVSSPYDGPGQITVFLANRVVLEILSAMVQRKVGYGN